MNKIQNQISYGKNVYDKREIAAVIKTLKKVHSNGFISRKI